MPKVIPRSYSNRSKCTMRPSSHPLILTLGKFFGSLPIRKTTSGWQFSVLSPEFLCCVLLYIALLPNYWILMKEIYNPLFMVDADDLGEAFNLQIYYELFATLLVPYILTPLTSWLDAPRVAAYLNEFNHFQDTFEAAARKQLRFKLKFKQLLAFTAVGAILQNLAVQCAPPYLSVWKTPACTINILVLCCYLSFWICLSDALGQAGEAITHDLKIELASARCSPRRIAAYKQLWRQLTALTTNSSSQFYRSATVPILLTFWMITLSIYGLVSSLRDPIFSSFYAFCVVFNILPLFLICNNGYTTMIKVRNPTMELLVTVRRSKVNAACWQEVSSFLQLIEDSPPIITLGGYAVLDRRFLHAAGTTISTYLVVIFQFSMSLKQDAKKSTH